MNRRTIARPVSLEGIGLHLGAACRLSFRPAASGAGIVFRRTDLAGAPTIPARRRARGAHRAPHAARRRSGVGAHGGARARRGGGLRDRRPRDRARRGRAADHGRQRRAVRRRAASAGIVEQAGEVQVSSRCAAPIAFARRRVDATRSTPAPDLELDVTIEFPHALIGRQRGCYRVTRDSVRAGARAGADVRVRARGRGAAVDGADPGRVARQRRRARRRMVWSGTTAALARRVRAAQGDGLCWRPRAWPARACARAITAIKPSHRGTVSPGARHERGDREGDDRDRDRRDHEGAAAPLSVPARGSRSSRSRTASGSSA